MTELIRKKSGRLMHKFHQQPKNFKRTEKLKYLGKFLEIKVDKNDSVYDLAFCNVTLWKNVVRNGRKTSVPDVVEHIKEPKLMEKVRGVPFSIAIEKIKTYIEIHDYQMQDTLFE